MISLEFITDFGDSAVTGATALVVACALFFTKDRRAAIAMLIALGASVAIITVAKIILYNVDLFPVCIRLHSPSGHTAVSTAVYGTLAVIITSSLRARYRVPVYIVAAFFVSAIAFTRVVLGRHSVSEVLCGFGVGAAICIALTRMWLQSSSVRINKFLLIAITLFTIFMVHGTRLPAEPMIDDIAMRF